MTFTTYWFQECEITFSLVQNSGFLSFGVVGHQGLKIVRNRHILLIKLLDTWFFYNIEILQQFSTTTRLISDGSFLHKVFATACLHLVPNFYTTWRHFLVVNSP